MMTSGYQANQDSSYGNVFALSFLRRTNHKPPNIVIERPCTILDVIVCKYAYA